MDFVGLLAARGAKLAVGLATMFVYARMFGVTVTYDAWIWSLGIVNAAGLILFGPITETIRASFAAIDRQEGRVAAEQYLVTVAVLMVGTSIVAMFGAMAILPSLATVLIDDRSGQSDAAIFFVYMLAPSVVVSQLVAVLTAHLNCFGKVYPPEIAGILGGAMGLLFVIVLPELPAHWLLLGSYYAGLIAPLFIGASFWPGLLRMLRQLDAAAFRRHAREALAFSSPLLLPYALGQVSGLVERQYALQAGAGVLAVLSYALFARNTVQAVFTAALSALAVPALSRAWDPNDRRAFRHAAREWAHQCLMLVTMGMIVLFGLSDLMPGLLFGAKIDAGAQLLLAKLLRCYAVAIIAVILYLIGGSMLLAARKGKTYASLGALAGVASTLALVAFFPLLGILAVPVALGGSHAGAAWMMFKAIDRADARWILIQASIHTLIALVFGWMVRWIGVAVAPIVPVSGRLALCLVAAGAVCGVWWALDRRDVQSRHDDAEVDA